MFTIILSILLDVFGYTMVLPLLPIIAKDFGASDIMIRLLISSNALAALIVIPIWGKLSDKYGRKPEERRAEIKAHVLTVQAISGEKSSIWNKEVKIRMIQIFLLSLISFIFTSSATLVLYKRYNADPSTTGLVMAVAGLSVMFYGGILMKPMIKKIGEKRLLFITFVLFIITFLFYPYLYELWMVFIFILPYSFVVAFMRPLITTNMTKAVGLDKQGELSGWSTNLQAFSQTIAPLIATGFLQLGGLTIGFIFFDSYHLIGFTNVILAVLLLIIGYLDIKHHPKLYYYERLRKKREAMRKKRLKKNPETPKSS